MLIIPALKRLGQDCCEFKSSQETVLDTMESAGERGPVTTTITTTTHTKQTDRQTDRQDDKEKMDREMIQDR